MSGYKISEAARATGFTESALRYYEKEGVVVPDRTDTGYRTYRDDDLESLRFVGRARRLGLRLHEITDLLALLQDDECAPVQTKMRQLVAHRITEAQLKVADLVGPSLPNSRKPPPGSRSTRQKVPATTTVVVAPIRHRTRSRPAERSR